MKNKCALVCFLLTFFVSLSAQEFLFGSYENGTAILKDNTVSGNQFNYNMVTGKFLFLENGEPFELTDPSSINYINAGGRLFEHIKGQEFYEKIDLNNIDLYVYWKSTRISKGKNTGYGTSQTSSSTNVNELYTSTATGNADAQHTKSTALSLSEQGDYLQKNTYYLKINNSFKKFDSIDSLAKLFKGQEDNIKNELKGQNLNFRNIDDVKRAVAYCAKFNK